MPPPPPSNVAPGLAAVPVRRRKSHGRQQPEGLRDRRQHQPWTEIDLPGSSPNNVELRERAPEELRASVLKFPEALLSKSRSALPRASPPRTPASPRASRRGSPRTRRCQIGGLPPPPALAPATYTQLFPSPRRGRCPPAAPKHPY